MNLADRLFATGASRKLSGAHARFAKPFSALVTIGLIVTNTIPLGPEKSSSKIRQLSVADTFGEAIKRTHEESSITSLFQ